MSYDIWLEINTGGTEPACVGQDWNYTSNCGPMWREAGADLAELHGQYAGNCLALLDKAITNLRTEPAKYRAMNPTNGWGSYDTLLPALEELAATFRAHPQATVQVSR